MRCEKVLDFFRYLGNLLQLIQKAVKRENDMMLMAYSCLKIWFNIPQ